MTNRGNIVPRPEQAISYSNPNVYARSALSGRSVSETRLANFAAAAGAGWGSQHPHPTGNYPTAAVIVAAVVA